MKEELYIPYEYLVLTPLVLLQERGAKSNAAITLSQILMYKVKLANVLTNLGYVVKFDTFQNEGLNFQNNFQSFINVFETKDEVYYSLKLDVDIEDVINKIYNELPLIALSYLTIPLIFEEVFEDSIKKRLFL